MIKEVRVYHCPKCDSIDIIKNGHDYKGAQKFHCKTCGAYGTLEKKSTFSQKKRQQVMDAYCERFSMHGIERIFDVSRYYLARWLLEALANLPPYRLPWLDGSLEMPSNWRSRGLLC